MFRQEGRGTPRLFSVLLKHEMIIIMANIRRKLSRIANFMMLF